MNLHYEVNFLAVPDWSRGYQGKEVLSHARSKRAFFILDAETFKPYLEVVFPKNRVSGAKG